MDGHVKELSVNGFGRRAGMRGVSERSRYIVRDKENICLFDQGNVETRGSPLPAGYPRFPLQDITAILSPLNQPREDEGGSDKPVKRPKAHKKQARPCPVLLDEVTNVSTRLTITKQDMEGETSKAHHTGAGPAEPQAINSLAMTRVEVLKPVEDGKDQDMGGGMKNNAGTRMVLRSSSETVVTAQGSGETSPRNQQIKRRKAQPKSTAGKNVARFR